MVFKYNGMCMMYGVVCVHFSSCCVRGSVFRVVSRGVCKGWCLLIMKDLKPRRCGVRMQMIIGTSGLIGSRWRFVHVKKSGCLKDMVREKKTWQGSISRIWSCGSGMVKRLRLDGWMTCVVQRQYGIWMLHHRLMIHHRLMHHHRPIRRRHLPMIHHRLMHHHLPMIHHHRVTRRYHRILIHRPHLYIPFLLKALFVMCLCDRCWFGMVRTNIVVDIPRGQRCT